MRDSRRYGRLSRSRGQLSLSIIEAGMGIVLIFTIVATFGVSLPPPGAEQAQLDTYAADTAQVLVGEPPRHGGTTRLAEVSRSPRTFRRERADFRHRVDRILPDNLMFRVELPHGTVGYPLPNGIAVGVATVPTVAGDVTISVWYA